ncbi:hypothetical protein BV898_07120 [Hypsibius exemplaris]|uniref:CAS1 domain-containing protein 1 n=1 Tax=Hypsibius exemplaris TaxID=2072580 RepID=A0A1W0WUI7_HYPEX|nr:hypothetical protein BV898_07120 [Hypsibius exemplaris]
MRWTKTCYGEVLRHSSWFAILKIALPCCLLPTVVFIVLERKRVAQTSKDIAAILTMISCRNADADTVIATGSCSRLLGMGEEYVDGEGARQWRPRGCSVQTYWPNLSLMSRCISEVFPGSKEKSRSLIVFMGDSRLRQLQEKLYWLITGTDFHTHDAVQGSPVAQPEPVMCDPPAQPHEDNWKRGQCNLTMIHPTVPITIKRVWDPMLDASLAQNHLNRLINRVTTKTLPKLLVLNSGAWLLKHCYDSGISLEACTKTYTKIILDIRPALKRLSALTTVIWMPQTAVDRRFATLFLTASQNGAIPVFNQIAACLLAETSVLFWWSSQQVYEYFADSHDGLHQGAKTLFTNAQMLINVMCNAAVGSNSSACCV